MKRENISNVIYIVLSIIIAALIVFGVLFLQQNQSLKMEQNETLWNEVAKSNGKSGKSAGNLISEDAENDTGYMFICKTELVGLYNKAKAVNAAGMLTLSDKNTGNNKCLFNIRNMSSPGNLGTIEASAVSENGQFEIKLEIDKARENQSLLWTEAALLYLNKQIDEKSASEAAYTALTDGIVESEFFTIKSRDGVSVDGTTVTPVKTIEITGFLPDRAE